MTVVQIFIDEKDIESEQGYNLINLQFGTITYLGENTGENTDPIKLRLDKELLMGLISDAIDSEASVSIELDPVIITIE